MATSVSITLAGITFGSDAIRDASVIEELNPFSVQVPINRLEVTLYSEDADFSILNPSGNYQVLQYRTPVTVTEAVDGKQISIGQYYLDKWENVSDTLIKLECMDAIGLLDILPFRGGIWLTPVTVGELLDLIFYDSELDYEVDPQVAAIELTGWLPISTRREALQQVCFAAGAYAMSARQEGFVKIASITSLGTVTKGIRSGVARVGQSRVWQKRWRQSQWDLILADVFVTKSEIGIDASVSLRPLVTGVEVSMHDIVVGDGVRKLFEGTLSVGTHEIQFSQPMHTLSITGATITGSGANYAVVSVASEGEVLLEGLVYDDTVSVYGVYLQDAEGKKQNVIAVTDASLVNSSNGATVAQRLYDYYQDRYEQNVRIFKPEAQVGGVVIVDTLYDQQIRGILERMEINLSGGFIANARVVGDVEDSSGGYSY